MWVNGYANNYETNVLKLIKMYKAIILLPDY